MDRDSKLIFEAYDSSANDVLFKLKLVYSYIQRHQTTDGVKLHENFHGEDMQPYITALHALKLITVGDIGNKGGIITAVSNKQQIDWKPT